MSPRVVYRIEHDTRYVHSGLASTSQHIACLKPRTLDRQRLVWHELTIDPAPAAIRERIDYFGNHVSEFSILAPYTEMQVLSRSEVELQEPVGEVDFGTSPSWESVRESLLYSGGAPFQAASEFSYPSPYAPVSAEVDAFARAHGFFTPDRPILAAAIDLMHQIHDEFTFDPAATSVATPLTEVLAKRRGVCQDFAHLFIAALRSLGLPARYVSGYLLTDAPEGQPKLVGADASHAWAAVWCPTHGWLDLDPTNDVIPSMRHVTLAWGRDYGDVSPLRGVVLGGQEHQLNVEVSVYPLSA